MLVIVSGAVPVFLSVDDCGALVVPISCEPNARLDGVSVAAGAGVPPAPLRASACGLPVALSEICTVAARGPVALGEKVTVMVQVALAARDAGQSLVCAKSLAFAPVTAMPAIVSGAVPEFRSVDGCDALVVPTSCEPNVRLVGVSVTAKTSEVRSATTMVIASARKNTPVMHAVSATTQNSDQRLPTTGYRPPVLYTTSQHDRVVCGR